MSKDVVKTVESKVGVFSSYQTVTGHGQDIPFTQKPAQQLLRGVGVPDNIKTPLSQKSDGRPLGEQPGVDVTITSFDPNSQSKLIITGARIDRLAKSAKTYVNTDIVPEGHFKEIVSPGTLIPQTQDKSSTTGVHLQNMAVGVCHVQEIDLLATPIITSDGKAVLGPREGKIDVDAPAMLLLSTPALNFAYGTGNNLTKEQKQEYIESMYRIIFHAAVSEGREYIALPAAGLGVFGGNPEQYFSALMKVAKEFPQLNIIYNSGHPNNAPLFDKLLEEHKPTNIMRTDRDVLFLAHELTQQGHSCAFHNPSDADVVLGINDVGEYWKAGKGSSYVGEEHVGAMSTAPLNSRLLNPGAYQTVVERAFLKETPTVTEQQDKTVEETEESVVQPRSVISESPQVEVKPEVVSTPLLHSPVTEDEKAKVNELIGSFNPSSPQQFQAACDNMVKQMGFEKFRNAVDSVLTEKFEKRAESIRYYFAGTTKKEAFSALNEYLVKNAYSTFAEQALQGVQIQSQAILDALNEAKTPKYMEIARKKVEQLKEKKEKAIEKAKEEAIQKINEINDKNPPDRVEEIAKIQDDLQQKITEISAKEYSVESFARLEALDDLASAGKFTTHAAQGVNVTSLSIIKDLLSEPSVAARTVKMERYLQIAEEALKQDNFAVAITIQAALSSASISRLTATRDGLSAHSKEIMQELETVSSNQGSYKYLRTKVAGSSHAYLTADVIARDVAFLVDGNKENGIAPDIAEALLKQHQKVKGLSSPKGNETYSQELNRNRIVYDEKLEGNALSEAMKKRADKMETEFYKVSNSDTIEKRGNKLKASPIMQVVGSVMRPTKREEILQTQSTVSMQTSQNVDKSVSDARLKKLQAWKEAFRIKGEPEEQSKDERLHNISVQQVAEIMEKQMVFVSGMEKMQQMLHLFKAQGNLNSSEKAFIDDYLVQIERLLAAQQNFGSLLDSIHDDGSGPRVEELIQKLHDNYQSKEFSALMEQLGKISGMYNNIREIYRKHSEEKVFKSPEFLAVASGFSISTFAITPVQRLVQMGTLVESVKGTIEKLADVNKDLDLMTPLQQLNEAHDRAKSEAINSNALSAIEAGKWRAKLDFEALASQGRVTALLRNIVNISVDDKDSIYGSYVPETLVRIFPDTFTINGKGLLLVRGPDVNKNFQIMGALGLGVSPLETQTVLDPKQFNAEQLDKLYEQDNNKLWLILKSAKPVNESFTAAQKIQAYAQVAQVLKNGELGDKNKSQQAYELAKAAMEIAKQYPEAGNVFASEFGPESGLGKWIIGKTKKTEREAVINDLIFKAPAKPTLPTEDTSETITQVTTEERQKDRAPKFDRIVKAGNLYEVLNVPFDASAEVIRKAYHNLALQVHPDKNTLEDKQDAQDAFDRIREAYATLTDPEQRANYDNGISTQKNQQIHQIDYLHLDEPKPTKPTPTGQKDKEAKPEVVSTPPLLPYQASDADKAKVNRLIENFSAMTPQQFQDVCDFMVQQMGFEQFRSVVDIVMTEKFEKRVDSVRYQFAGTTKKEAFSALNEYIVKNTHNTFSELALQAAKVQSQAILDALNEAKTPKYIEKGQRKIEQLRENAIEKAKADALQKIDEINDKNQPNRVKEIAKVQDDLQQKIAEIRARKYSVENFALHAAFHDLAAAKKYSLEAAQNLNAASFSIMKDILTEPSVAARTVKVERYLQIADEALKQNNFAVAWMINAALNDSSIVRLKATQDGLSPQGQAIKQELETIFSTESNSKNIRTAVLNSSHAYLTTNLVSGDMQFVVDGNNETGISQKIADAWFQQHQKVIGLSSPKGNDTYLRELNRSKVVYDKKLKGPAIVEILNQHAGKMQETFYKASNSEAIEKRGNNLQASPIMEVVGSVMRPAKKEGIVQTSVSAKTDNSRNDAQLKKLEAWKDAFLIKGNSEELPKDERLHNISVQRVAEIMEKQMLFTSQMERMQQMLHFFKEQANLNSSEKAFIDDFLAQTEQLLAIQQEMGHPVDFIHDDGSGPRVEELIQKIHDCYQSGEFVAYMGQLSKLVGMNDIVRELYKKHEKEVVFVSKDYMDLSIAAAQRVGQMNTLVSALKSTLENLAEENKDLDLAEPLKNISAALERAEKEGLKANQNLSVGEGKWRAKLDFESLTSEGREAALLRNIVHLTAEKKTIYGSYVPETLARIFPDTFTINGKGVLLVRGPDANKNLQIMGALGLGVSPLETQTILDPKQFNAEQLDKLYEQDNNKLWLILKSAKPVDESFTPEQKIQAFAQVAQLIKNKQLGNTNKSTQAYALAKAAMAIAKDYPEAGNVYAAEFGPNSSLGKWIIQKTSEKEAKESVINNLSFNNATQPPKSTLGTANESTTPKPSSQSETPSSLPWYRRLYNLIRGEGAGGSATPQKTPQSEETTPSLPWYRRLYNRIRGEDSVTPQHTQAESLSLLSVPRSEENSSSLAPSETTTEIVLSQLTPKPVVSRTVVSRDTLHPNSDVDSFHMTSQVSMRSQLQEHRKTVVVNPGVAPLVHSNPGLGARTLPPKPDSEGQGPKRVRVQPVVNDSNPVDEGKLISKVVNYYNAQAKDVDGEYKSGYEEPKIEDKTAKFTFPNPQTSTAFLKNFAATNIEANYLVRNNSGEVIAKVEAGKLKVYDGVNKDFKEADEHSVIPKTGMSEEDFAQYNKEQEPEDEDTDRDEDEIEDTDDKSEVCGMG